MRAYVRIALLLAVTLIAACASPPPPQHHPAYLHALSDLRAARWMIEHRPGDWAQTNDEIAAVRQIDAAIGDLRQAAYDDGKPLNEHPAVQDIAGRPGRLHAALDYLYQSRNAMSHEEDNPNASAWRGSALGHVDAAVAAVHRALGE